MSTLSVIIITKNEEANIHRCLESVKWANEIVVLDSGSTDNTLNICREYTDKVFQTDWPGFGPQKNRALEKATQDWVLSIDADEVLSTELIEEIKSLLVQPSSTLKAYRIRRISSFCGKWIRFGEWRKDQPLRLFKRISACFDNALVHESIQFINPNTKIGLLKNFMWHYTYQNLSQIIQKIDLYSSYSAEMKFKKGQKSNLLIALLRSSWSFFKGYVLKLGFLDGREGFLLAVSNAMGVFYRYAKLIYLYKKTL
jgi:glycosyltransferase involved in cell wall biosynthesis